MTSSHWLADYCRSQPGLVVIPIEALSPAGIDPAFANSLEGHESFSREWITRFNRAFDLYGSRAAALRAKAPHYWYPPRFQHICIVTRPETVRPYFQPFHANSWLLYEHDFDAEYSTTELSVFLMFQAERMGVMGEIVPALHANLPYFLTLGRERCKELRKGCQKTDRPDARAYRVLGESLTWLKSLYHEQLRPPKMAQPGMRIHRENGLIVPAPQAERVGGLQESWGRIAREVLAAYRDRLSGAGSGGVRGLGQWLLDRQPRVLVTASDGEILWHPDGAGEQDRLRPALAAMTPSGADRIRRDLEVIDEHSRRFLSALREPAALAEPAAHMTEGGLSYIHADGRLIAYDIGPGRNESRLWEPSPPFERLMLGARTVHEWGHLAASSGWVAVADERRAERRALTERLAELFDEVLATAPAEVRRLTRAEEARLSAEHGSMGAGLLAAMLRRIEDYMANLVARRFLSADEMDTYVRNNVASRAGEYRAQDVYMQLVRLVYEYQYLALSRIENPRRWFESSTWIGPLIIERGVISQSYFEEIVETVSNLCGCYSVDESKFDFPVV